MPFGLTFSPLLRRSGLRSLGRHPRDDEKITPQQAARYQTPACGQAASPASLAGSYSWSAWMACRRSLEHPQLDILTMVEDRLFTALLPPILADDGFIPVTAYRTDEGAFEYSSPPQTLFDGRDAVKDLAGRETLMTGRFRRICARPDCTRKWT